MPAGTLIIGSHYVVLCPVPGGGFRMSLGVDIDELIQAAAGKSLTLDFSEAERVLLLNALQALPAPHPDAEPIPAPVVSD